MDPRSPAEGISVETVSLADDLAIVVLQIIDYVATGERSINDILGEALEKADAYRRSRMSDATKRSEL